MNRKRLFAGIVALLVLIGFWIARSNQRSSDITLQNPNNAAAEARSNQPTPERMSNSPAPRRQLPPPDPTRKFRELTPEQRVQYARKGHGPGG